MLFVCKLKGKIKWSKVIYDSLNIFSEQENFLKNAETDIESHPRFISKLETRLYMPILYTFPMHVSHAKDHL